LTRARGPRRLDLVERSGDLKRALVKFASAPRFDDAFEDALARRHGPDVTELDEGTVANVIDYLALQYRLPDGDTVVERFVAEHPELTQEERRPSEPGERERTGRRSARRSRPGVGRGSGRSR